MNLSRWLTTDIHAIIAYLDEEKALTESQHRCVFLFGHACCTRLLPNNPPPVYLRVLEIVLDSADGKTRYDDLNRIIQEVMGLEDDLTRIITFAHALNLCFADDPVFKFRALSELVNSVLEMKGDRDSELLCDFVRDIFGGHFYHVAIDPRWKSSTVLDLARTIEADSLFERMPILADALMDADCDDVTLLGHCLSGRQHVRGCWVLDLILKGLG